MIEETQNKHVGFNIEKSNEFSSSQFDYFIPCYNISSNEIFFCEYFTEKVIRLDSVQKEKIKSHESIDYKSTESERNQNIVNTIKFHKNKWEEIKLLSNFEAYSKLSQHNINYFKRPINSHFFYAENLDLYTFHNCYPLPDAFKSYGKAKIKIIVDFKNILCEEIYNYLPPDSREPFQINKKVSFLSVIDTIISDAIYELKLIILEQQKLIPKGSKEEDLFKNAYKSMLSDKENKFVLKLKSYEEYLYGDYSIGSYESVRKNVREYETTSLYLYKKPNYIIKPPNSHFPPIVPIDKSMDYNFFDLYDKYVEMYPQNSIIYRMYEASEEMKERYLKEEISKRDINERYGQSCDCDLPLSVSIVGLYRVKELEKWMDSEIYNKNEMMLPYFEKLTNIEEEEFIKDKSVLNKCEKNVKKRTKQEKEKIKDIKLFKKTLQGVLNKIIEDDKLQKSLNYLSVSRTNQKVSSNTNVNTNNIKKEKNNKLGKSNTLVQKRTSLFRTSTILQTEERIRTTTSSNQPQVTNQNTFFTLLKNKLPFNPTKIKVTLYLLYGSYEIQTISSNTYPIKPDIQMNSTFTFNSTRCKISCLPKETRIGINIICSSGSKNFILGSGEIPLYDEEGFLQSGITKIRIWPNFIVYAPINACSQFNLNYRQYIDYFDIKEGEISTEEKKLNEIVRNNQNIDLRGSDVYKSRKRNKTLSLQMHKKLKEQGLLNYIGEETTNEIYKQNQTIVFHDDNNFNPLLENSSEIIKQNEEEEKYCEIYIRFPSFSKKIIHCIKSPEDCINEIVEKQKYIDKSNSDNIRIERGKKKKEQKNIIQKNKVNSFYLMSYEDSQSIIASLLQPKDNNEIKEEEKSKIVERKNIYNHLEDTLHLMVTLLKKDPFTPLTQSERESIILCRDYITSIPSALILFLRAIDWFNPLEVNLAHLYLTKWTKIEAEDAISLLDSKFPDTRVREYAISILRNLTEDLISLYMLQMTQCLIYETHVLNPLSEFILECSLKNPKLIGNSFFWNAKVGMNNPLFNERLSILVCQLLMNCGPSFLEEMFKKIVVKFKFQEMSMRAKKAYANEPRNAKDAAKQSVANSLTDLTNENLLPFSLPIDPSYYCTSFDAERTKVFDSKMVPIKIACTSSDGSILNVMFKIGDDLRQDLLTLQVMKIMDKMWLENDLDLKISPYKILPTELKAGFIEFATGEVLDGLQKKEGFGGALDRELLIKHLRSVIVNINTGEVYESEKQYDNFIRSLAGYCVSTCVLGVADRHPGNVMVKSNGVFFHIDFGHILGNFKFKFGIKRERAPFLLTPEMSHVYMKTNNEEQFKFYCTKAFNILRHNATRLLNLIIIMSSAGMPEVCCMKDVQYLRDMLKLDLPSDEDATKYFLGLIDQSKNEKFRLLDNIIHNIKHG